MADTFVSWRGLMTRDMFGPQGKLASLWFDRIILQVPRDGAISGTLDHVVSTGRMKHEDADTIQDFWVPVEHVLPKWEWVANPWEDVVDEKVRNVAIKITSEAIEAQYPNAPHNAFMHELSSAGAGLINSVTTWGALVARAPCNFLAHETESHAIAELFAARVPDEFATFTEVVSARLPDLTGLSWNAVLDLRHHKYIEHFREKITELHQLSRSGDVDSACDMLCEIERKDLVEIARLAAPSPSSAIWKGIGSNVPLPIPINPLSAAFAADDIAKEYEKQTRFGWLYFLLDCDDDVGA